MKTTIKTSAFVKYDSKLIHVEIYDKISIEKLNERKIRIIKEGGHKIPTNDLNPVYKIATALQNLKPNKLGAVIKIKKNIPTFSGLSSQACNAAGVLVALNKLWKFNLNERELLTLAKKVDPKVAKVLKLQPKKWDKNVILVLPKYIRIDKKWIEIRSSGSYEKTACKYFPDLKEIIEILKKVGCGKCGMSGKGPMLYGFSSKKIDKQKIEDLLGNKSEFIWIK